jgi:hypothetical protein
MTDPTTLPAIAKGYVAALWTASLVIMPLIITAAVAQEQAKAIKGEHTNYGGILWTSIAVGLFMLVYSSFFMLIPNLCWWVATFMFPEKEWANLFARLNDTYWAVVNTDKGALADLRASILAQRIAMNFFHFLAMAAEDVFLVARFAFLGILYIIGPLVGVLSIHPITRNLFKGWVLSVLQVSLWIVVLRALQALLVAALGNSMPEPGMQGAINSIIFSVVIIFMFISVPLITSKVFTGQNIGTAGSLVIGGAMFLGSKAYRAVSSLSKNTEQASRGAAMADRMGRAGQRFANPGAAKQRQR